jgi:hypothetical protein
MNVTASNGITYQVRFDNNGNFEIERPDTGTGLQKVFVIQDISIGNYQNKRKECVFYSYDVSPTGERTYSGRHPFKDTDNEFTAFLESDIWDKLKNAILLDFLRKIEFTEPVG